MITRFFKKKSKSSPVKKASSSTQSKSSVSKSSSREKMKGSKKILTAEGWKRLMMRKTSTPKK